MLIRKFLRKRQGICLTGLIKENTDLLAFTSRPVFFFMKQPVVYPLIPSQAIL